ncbi:MAG TPA: S8 family serine peptidase [Bdellovibrionales bacterium]|nr:S8 family serine peptidase [Bdellovibrionales bacterium]
MKNLFLFVLIVVGVTHSQASEPKFPKISFVKPAGREPASVREKSRRSTVLFAAKKDLTPEQKKKLDRVLEKFDIKVEGMLAEGAVNFAKALKHPGVSEEEIVEELKNTGAMEFAEPDTLVYPSLVPNDPYAGQQWHHQNIGSYRAWDIQRGVSAVIVASCDTGVQPNHPDLRSILMTAYNSETNSNKNLLPVNSHGTVTAGAIAAALNNRVGVAGVGGGVRILPIKISNAENGAAYFSAITSCITYAANRGAKVVNLSYGGTESAAVSSAAKYLRSKGGILVVAAGNDGMDTSANLDYSSIYVVSATDQQDMLLSWSNRGTPTDIVAPGVDILTTDLGGGYTFASGTSLAAPLVAGAAALVYSVNPKFTPTQVESILSNSAQKALIAYDKNTYGAGRLDVEAAVKRAKASIPSRR